MLRIAVYAIALNERPFVQAFCESAQGADLILIADTGSTDGTAEAAADMGAWVHDISIKPWRFDDARNVALALVPADIDICIALDLDEQLQPGWREEVERCWTEGVTRMRYRFDWGSGIEFYSEKIHARRGYRWHHPCHERVVSDRIEEKLAWTDQTLIVHKPDASKSRGQYFDLLALSVKEDPHCERNAFYFARELHYYGRHQEAVDACARYLAMPNAVWAEERSYAMRIMARAYDALGDRPSALTWARRSTAEAPDAREPWCEVAQRALNAERWQESYSAALVALSIPSQAPAYMNEPAVYGAWPHDLAATAASRLGLQAKALEHAKAALALAPDDERLRGNVAVIEGLLGVGPT